jgi:glycosyltransferase involved in cell wall biosynthesis
MTVALAIGAVVALQALVLGLVNMRRYRRAPDGPASETLVSVCIPARNEEPNVEACVRAALASEGVAVEVLCYDDQSTDRTPEILARLAAEDPRLRVPPTRTLPDGWNGKQHACERMGEAARGEWLLFTDADVRLAPDALRRTLAFARAANAELVSTVPYQRVGSVGEGLFVPLIHFVLLSYLPFGRMRSTPDPAASAGCGQYLFARREAYRASGGHAAFRASMHDGVRMPRAFRAAGFRTDLFDGTDLVSCRMYRGLGQTWRGFAKNAFEGLGSVTLLVVVTALHVVGHLLPWAWLGYAAFAGDWRSWPTTLACLAIAFGLAERVALCIRFRQPWWCVPLHPVSIAAMTAVQWWSLWLAKRGKRSWKGRTAGG